MVQTNTPRVFLGYFYLFYYILLNQISFITFVSFKLF